MFVFHVRLIHDREIMLFDGTRLLGRDRFCEAKKHAGLNDEEMAERFINICLCMIYRIILHMIGPYFK